MRHRFPEGWFFCCYVIQDIHSCINSQNISQELLSSNSVSQATFSKSNQNFQKPSTSFSSGHDYCQIINNVDIKKNDTTSQLFQPGCVKMKINSGKSEVPKKVSKNIPTVSDHTYCKFVAQGEFTEKTTKCATNYGNTIERNSSNASDSNKFQHEDDQVAASQLFCSSLKLLRKFHCKLNNLSILQCRVCKEAWCHIVNNLCGRCKRDKIKPRKFSAENDMIPSKVPDQLLDLSQAEEMLIARAFPVMNIYCKPRGGQRVCREHVITFPTNVQTIADTLPNCPQDLPIIRLVSENSNYKSKDFRVRRDHVLNALL